jgi:diguanylate cyclase (GGDEF)-like protein
MMSYQLSIGVLLIAGSTIAFVCGLYATHGSFKLNINKLLMFICLALLVWSLGLAITATAANIEISAVGHLIAPIGWGPMSGLLLHFVLLLVGKEKLLKKWWAYAVLYLPGTLMILMFTILPLFGINTDSFVYTPYGWTPVVEPDIWDTVFIVYYSSYAALSIIILLATRRTTTESSLRLQVTLLAAAFSVAYFLGSLFDVTLESLSIYFPQIAPVFSVLGTGAIAYSVHRHRPLHEKPVNQGEIILTDDVRSSIYTLMAVMFIIGGILILTHHVIAGDISHHYAHIYFLITLVVAGFIYSLKWLRLSHDLKDLLITIAYLVFIPVIFMRFIHSGSITVWAFVLLVMMIAMLYNNQFMLLGIGSSTFMNLAVIWGANPNVRVTVETSDHIVRLVFVAIGTALALYVNNIYIARLRANAIYAQTRQSLSDISQALLSVREQTINERAEMLLAKCGSFLGCRHAYVVLFNEDRTKIIEKWEWLAEGMSQGMDGILNNYDDTVMKLFRQLESNALYAIPDTNLLSPTTAEERELFTRYEMRAVVAVPLKDDNGLVGLLGFHSNRPLNEWERYSPDYLQIVAGMVSDTIARIKGERHIRYLAYHDQLTSLPNRDLFKEHLQLAIEQTKKSGKMVAVIYVDLDSFKSINDTMGHDLGDELLTEVARRLSGHMRPGDVASRFGGDEFLIMINQVTTNEEIIGIVEKLMQTLQRPYYIEGIEYFVTTSAGIALYPQDGDDVDTLIRKADIAMYRAKELGKNSYQLCSDDMRDQMMERVRLTNHLYRALERRQLELYYQPQVNMREGRIRSVEALLRWHLPEVGLISPSSFIRLAEQAGLINEIGAWVLETACRQSGQWQEKGLPKLRMAVNVSLYQLYDPGFVQLVDDTLKRTRLEPSDLELEITETALGGQMDDIVNTLTQLKRVGVSIALDDFGAEYSSLTRLRLLPVDRIKMGAQLVLGAGGSMKGQIIAEMIIGLAQRMNLEVIAEGIETEQQVEYLRSLGCDVIQGYYFYKPMPAHEIEKLFQ